MEETKLDAKNVEENKRNMIAQRLNVKPEDVPSEILDNNELGDLLIFGGEVKESFPSSLRKIKSLAESEESYVRILKAAGFKEEEAVKLFNLI